MALSDPQSVTLNGVATSLPRIKSEGLSATYAAVDGNLTLTVSHKPSNQRVRSMERVDQRIIAADPITSVNDYETASAYLVIDRPIVGFTLAQIQYLVAGLVARLTNAEVAKLYGSES